MDRIISMNPEGTEGRMIWAGGVCDGPLPPFCGEMRVVYDLLIAEGVLPEPYVAPIDLRAYLANLRFKKEADGIQVGGATIRTDRESQAMISGAFALAKDDPTITVKFKAADAWLDLPADQVLAIGRAVARHVQACFTAEAAVDAQLDAGQLATPADVDAAFAAAFAA